jgi:phosphoribosylcarboxyaminoimidazole (NCAIR) mutase
VDSAANAGLLAVQMLSLKDEKLKSKLRKYRSAMAAKVMKDDKSIN